LTGKWPAARVIRAALLVAGLLGCEDRSHRDIGDEINILSRRDDALVGPATERLASYGRKAIPQIETALHTAGPQGRLHLVAALGRIGDHEGIPILRHAAIYDVRDDVRAAAESFLARWAAESGARADRARAALASIANKRASGEGPLLLGESGTPGVPSTIGSPPPSPSR
jgi:HEAT repeat protein